MLESGHLSDLFVPALDQVVQTVHELGVVLDLVIKVALLNVSPIFGGLFKLDLHLGVDREFHHWDLHILARLGKVHLQEAEAFKDAVESASCLGLVTS